MNEEANMAIDKFANRQTKNVKRTWIRALTGITVNGELMTF